METRPSHHVQPSATSASDLSPHARPYSHTAILPQTQPFVQPARSQVQNRCACHRTDGKTAATLESAACTSNDTFAWFQKPRGSAPQVPRTTRPTARPARGRSARAAARKGNHIPFRNAGKHTAAGKARHPQAAVVRRRNCGQRAYAMHSRRPRPRSAPRRTQPRKLPINGRLWKTQNQCASAGRTAKPLRRKRPASRQRHGRAAHPLRFPCRAALRPRRGRRTLAPHTARRKKGDPLTGRSLF